MTVGSGGRARTGGEYLLVDRGQTSSRGPKAWRSSPEERDENRLGVEGDIGSCRTRGDATKGRREDVVGYCVHNV
jgi:hypothetical protein